VRFFPSPLFSLPLSKFFQRRQEWKQQSLQNCSSLNLASIIGEKLVDTAVNLCLRLCDRRRWKSAGPRALVRRVLKIDPWRLNQSPAKTSAPRKKSQTTFFQLPVNVGLPESASATLKIADCRLQFERSDGSRLTLLLPELDLTSLNCLAADFLRDGK
jgi:hypothetical protein